MYSYRKILFQCLLISFYKPEFVLLVINVGFNLFCSARKWNDECPATYGWDVAEKIVFLIQDTNALQQFDRFQALLREFAKTSCNGYVSFLKNLTGLCTDLFSKYWRSICYI